MTGRVVYNGKVINSFGYDKVESNADSTIRSYRLSSGGKYDSFKIKDVVSVELYSDDGNMLSVSTAYPYSVITASIDGDLINRYVFFYNAGGA